MTETETRTRVGVVLPRDLAAQDVLELARTAEQVGLASVWVVEDLGFRGAFSQAAAVLAATSSLDVGIGIAPVGARVVEFAAMEVATLAQLFPGRLTVGVGHGMPGWMRSIGAWPASPLGALEHHLGDLRAMLTGGRSRHGMALDPACVPDVVPRLLAGVRGPRSLGLSGRVADGTLLAEPVTPEYVGRVRAAVGDAPGHQLVAYHLACVREDLEAAAAVVRPALGVVGEADWAPHVDPLPFVEDLRRLRAASASAADFAARLPTAWVEQLAVCGPARAVRARLAAIADAGVGEHVLVPLTDDPVAEVRRFASLLAP